MTCWTYAKIQVKKIDGKAKSQIDTLASQVAEMFFCFITVILIEFKSLSLKKIAFITKCEILHILFYASLK